MADWNGTSRKTAIQRNEPALKYIPKVLIRSILVAFFALSRVPGETVDLRYAENFSIEEFESYRIVTVRNPWRGSGETLFQYALVPIGDELPELSADTRIIRTPVKRLAVLGTVYLAHVEALDLYQELIGVAHARYASDRKTLQQLKNGYTKSIPGEGSIDIEVALSLQPDLILASALGDPQHDAHPLLERTGQSVAITAGYMEKHPLGRAEWLKFTAAFFEKDAMAKALFDGIADRYEKLSASTEWIERRPTVLANAPFAGTWHVPGGKSFTAQAIDDAGGRYLFQSIDSSGGVPVELEKVFFQAVDADFWIHPGRARSLAELESMDRRFVEFRAFKNGKVYNNSKRIGPGGGNEVWERGVLRPDETLADLIAIFHPELIGQRELVYYERVLSDR